MGLDLIERRGRGELLSLVTRGNGKIKLKALHRIGSKFSGKLSGFSLKLLVIVSKGFNKIVRKLAKLE